MERHRFVMLSLGLLLTLATDSVFAVMYKWYDEQGKVNYTQAPPPKGSRQAAINTDTFNTVEMPAVPTINAVTKPKREVVRKKAKVNKTRSTCPLRRTR